MSGLTNFTDASLDSMIKERAQAILEVSEYAGKRNNSLDIIKEQDEEANTRMTESKYKLTKKGLKQLEHGGRNTTMNVHARDVGRNNTAMDMIGNERKSVISNLPSVKKQLEQMSRASNAGDIFTTAKSVFDGKPDQDDAVKTHRPAFALKNNKVLGKTLEILKL